MTSTHVVPPASAAGGALPRQVEVVSIDTVQALCTRLRLSTIPRAVLRDGEVRVGMLAMTINPADVLQVDGRYGTRPALPFVPGHEGVAVVLACGPGVDDLAVGTHVLPMGIGGYWRDEAVVPRRQLVALPAGADVLQSAMLTANPATAWVLLRHLRPLADGDWVVQNAANSAVGQCVRQLAPQLGLNVLNVVRRADAVGASAAGSHWLVDAEGSDAQALQAEAERITQGAPVRLALDAVGGAASNRLAACLADNALQVVYGLMSGEPCAVAAEHLVFRGLQLQGFWLARWFASAENRAKARTLYPDLVAMLQSGALSMDVEATYGLAQAEQALLHAARPGRSGKVLLTGSWWEQQPAIATGENP